MSKELVKEAFAAAHENGYDFVGMTPWDIAVDMVTFNPAMEDLGYDEVERLIKEIQAEAPDGKA